MHFKLEYIARWLRTPEETPLQLELGGPDRLCVTIRSPTQDERRQGYVVENSFCIARLEKVPSARVRQVFEQIDANKILAADADQRIACEYTNAKGVRVRLPSPVGFPDFFQSFLRVFQTQLTDAVTRTVRILRWRTDQPGPPRPFSASGTSWSFDGVFWHPAPPDFSARLFDVQGIVRPTPSQKDDISSLLRIGQDEPIYHALFREAWEQRASNPGSALVIGVAALEVGIKTLIASLVPEARWLAMHLPVPPLVQTLVDYLPTLPARQTFGGKVKPPPPTVLGAIRKGVALRNGLAHRGQGPPDEEALESILVAVKDCLWLFDYYGGHAWATGFMSQDSLEALK